ncbi:YlmC/YmxH family sporulation protein [Tissierella sp.]|uniref:YlmC/YmxH family sporulation protein n=1 Tax=Tissierella sp. TaxID=41274 RepID=UPI00285888FE|nr:YlmC/YmxH family sporulation protein [Tissierella sp.]MDR7856217.1 YlmC/YmxH family sporulation protein [Tissierella sp.]
MRLTELGDKEIVNLNNGGRLGLIADSDFLIDENTGKIISLLVPERKFSLRIFGLENNGTEIPWNAIRKIGYDMIIIELDS